MQTSTPTPVASPTPPASTWITGNLSRCGNWVIYAVDPYGNALGGIPVTLHIMGIDRFTTFPDNTQPGIGEFNFSSHEIYSETRITDNATPYVGRVSFNDVVLNLSSEDNPYIYMDATTRSADGKVMYGKSYDYSLMCEHFGTSIASIVLRPQEPSSAPISMPSSVPSTAAIAGYGMIMELVMVIAAMIMAGGAYSVFKKR
jgi:hypothetical protein